MTYYVSVFKNNRKLGELRHGRTWPPGMGSSYASVAGAKLAARKFLAKVVAYIFECQVRSHTDHKIHAVVSGRPAERFEIRDIGKGKLWIQHPSGEGGEFDAERFWKAVTKYYREEF